MEFIPQIGDEVNGQKEAQSGLGEKAERIILSIEQGRIDLPPISPALKRLDHVIRFAAIETALKEIVSRIGVTAKRVLDFLDDLLFVAYLGLL